MKNVLRLTPIQARVLLDRVEGAYGACIADALEVPTDDKYRQAEDRIVSFLKTGLVPVDELTDLERRILVDSYEGSLHFAEAENQGGPLAASRAERTLNLIRDKLTAAGLPPRTSPIW